MTDAGHVFVVRGRLEHLDHDATLIPTDRDFVVTPAWAAPLAAAAHGTAGGGSGRTSARRASAAEDAPDDAWAATVRGLRPTSWSERGWGRAADGRPAWFVDSAAYDDPEATLGPMVDRVHAVLMDIASAGISARSGRPRPLVALPTLGVRQGGFGDLRGTVIDRLLSVCQDVVERTGVDVVVVAANDPDHAAFQARRRAAGGRHAAHLPPELLDQARMLARRALEGSLALFLGAGVGMSAGLPSWSRLIERLAERADADFGRLSSPLDKSELLRRRLGADLGCMVAEEVRGTDRYGIVHALIAAFDCEQAVTTNYDDLYERAAADAGRELAVLPWAAARPGAPWLLKMHGDVEHPESIVLSRSDVVGYDARSRPMSAVVQALMVTKHLLVVGASMTDDNFLRLAHEVVAFQEAGPTGPAPLGTVLALRPDPAAVELWRGRFEHLSASQDADGDPGDHARRLAVLLDAVAMHATPPAHLADERYAALLPDDERPLADAARDLRRNLDAVPGRGDSWRGLERALDDIGA
ncbi:SIR2 family protein [Actinotalea sp. AC32]|nr:SIR2 family protein [Actinotalea sp. AC32]